MSTSKNEQNIKKQPKAGTRLPFWLVEVEDTDSDQPEYLIVYIPCIRRLDESWAKRQVKFMDKGRERIGTVILVANQESLLEARKAELIANAAKHKRQRPGPWGLVLQLSDKEMRLFCASYSTLCRVDNKKQYLMRNSNNTIVLATLLDVMESKQEIMEEMSTLVEAFVLNSNENNTSECNESESMDTFHLVSYNEDNNNLVMKIIGPYDTKANEGNKFSKEVIYFKEGHCTRQAVIIRGSNCESDLLQLLKRIAESSEKANFTEIHQILRDRQIESPRGILAFRNTDMHA